MDPLAEHDPKRVGPYRLLGRLGAGGMGQVFLGADGRGELVAIKVVHPGLAYDEQFRARFRREVEISRKVTGPWVAAVVDADPDAPAPWLATKYVRGPSLDRAVSTAGPLPAVTVHVLAHGLAVALQAVHGAGLVHRDLKPSNVLLDDDHPRLIDFGISRALDGTRMTSTGMVIGTPAFMSPEQIAGTEVGTASDVFSLGSVLCYAATGRSPFGDVPPVVLMLRISQHEPDLDTLPDALRGPIAACLAKRPEDRPTAAELGGLLGTVVAEGPGWLPPAVTALTADLDEPTLQHIRVDRQQPVRAVRPAQTRRTVLVTLGILGMSAAGVALTNSGVGIGSGRQTPRERWSVPFGPAIGWHETWAADDSTIYACRTDGLLEAADSATGAMRWSMPLRQGSLDSHLEPVNGRYLVVATPESVTVLDAATGTRRWQLPRQFVKQPRIAVANGIVVAEFPPHIVALEVVTGTPLRSDPLTDLSTAGFAAQDDVCFLGVDGTVVARDLPTGITRWNYDIGTEGESALVAAGDRVFVRHAGSESLLLALDATTGRELWRRQMAFSDGRYGQEVVHPAGDVLVVHRRRANRSIVNGLDMATGAERWVAPEPGAALYDVVVADGLVWALKDASPTGIRPTTGFGVVVALDATTGTQHWTYDDKSSSIHPGAAAGQNVYLHGSSGRLIALSTG